MAFAGESMDLEVNTSIDKLLEILKEIGFGPVKISTDFIETEIKERWGRVHVLAKEIDKERIYLDIHWDALVHFVFVGVDYSKRPRKICEMILDKLTRMGFEGKITGGTNWFNRRNKALFKGLKIS